MYSLIGPVMYDTRRMQISYVDGTFKTFYVNILAPRMVVLAQVPKTVDHVLLVFF